jgi:arylsulfatase A-like enzyme
MLRAPWTARPARRLLGFVALAAGAAACAPSGPRPDVVLVLVDTLRADHLGAYGYARPTSPTIDALAAEGVVFERAISASTWTKPAVASLFTALQPTEHGIVRQLRENDPELVSQVLPRSLPTLAERFRAARYRTIAAVRQPNLLAQMGFGRGFDVYDAPAHGDAFALVDRLLARLDEVEGDRPVFLYLHLLDVHWPYDEMLPGVDPDAFGALDPDERAWVDRAAVRRARRRGYRELDWPTMIARYDHGVRFADAAIGRLFDGLRERARWESTIVAVTADHGEGFAEHGRFEHSYEPFQEVARIPLVLRLGAGGPRAAGRRATVVGLADLGPTLLELSGQSPWRRVSGRSFASVALGAEQPERAALVQMERASALVGSRHSLILGRNGGVRFFDLEADPAEKVNLAAGGCSGPCREALAELRRREAALKPPPPTDAVRVDYTPEQLEELRALGYL